MPFLCPQAWQTKLSFKSVLTLEPKKTIGKQQRNTTIFFFLAQTWNKILFFNGFFFPLKILIEQVKEYVWFPETVKGEFKLPCDVVSPNQTYPCT